MVTNRSFQGTTQNFMGILIPFSIIQTRQPKKIGYRHFLCSVLLVTNKQAAGVAWTVDTVAYLNCTRLRPKKKFQAKELVDLLKAFDKIDDTVE